MFPNSKLIASGLMLSFVAIRRISQAIGAFLQLGRPQYDRRGAVSAPLVNSEGGLKLSNRQDEAVLGLLRSTSFRSQ